jgi:hypothetical protein
MRCSMCFKQRGPEKDEFSRIGRRAGELATHRRNRALRVCIRASRLHSGAMSKYDVLHILLRSRGAPQGQAWQSFADCASIRCRNFRLIQGGRFDCEGKGAYPLELEPSPRSWNRFRAIYHGPPARIGSDASLSCTAAGEIPS